MAPKSTTPVPGTAGPVRVLALGGSTRAWSSSETALRRAADAAVHAGAVVDQLIGRDLMLPIYEPDANGERTPAARRLLAAVRAADALLISSPGYHGTLSGMIKNALDHLEDLREDPRPYLDGMPVGCIAVADGWQAAVGTLHTLRTAVHALRGWPSPLGVAINAAAGPPARSNGGYADATVLDQLSTAASQVVEFAALRKEAARSSTKGSELQPDRGG